MKQCCTLSFAIKGFREGFAVAPQGARFTCPRCGQSFRKQGRWVPIRTADDIIDMMAEEHARQAREKNA